MYFGEGFDIDNKIKRFILQREESNALITSNQWQLIPKLGSERSV